MRYLLLLILALPAFASDVKVFSYSELKSVPSSIKEWRNFETTKGFSLKSPTCWEIQNDDIDFEGPAEESSTIRLSESAACARPKLYEEVHGPNSFQVAIFPLVFKTEKERLKELEHEIEVAKKVKATPELTEKRSRPFIRHLRIDGDDVIESVRKLSNGTLRWSKVVYCKNLSKIRISGPMISHPHPKFLDRFENGQFSIPEPEKTIYESVRCR